MNVKTMRWAPALALALVTGRNDASAEETGVLTVTGVFHSQYVLGTVAADMTGVANGNENAWTMTLHGCSYSHQAYGNSTYGYSYLYTFVEATSFDLVFTGPDADVLNGAIVPQLAGGPAHVQMENAYSLSSGAGSFAAFYVWNDAGFMAWNDLLSDLLPADASGYPVLDPQTVSDLETDLPDGRSGSSATYVSYPDTIAIDGDPGSPVAPTIGVADASVNEGSRGSTKAYVTVSLANTADHAITVAWRTVEGTAKAKADFTAASGTLTFLAGETSKRLVISIKCDRVREPDETFTVVLSSPAGSTIADATGVVTILNDD
jgi:hypothetical protein